MQEVINSMTPEANRDLLGLLMRLEAARVSRVGSRVSAAEARLRQTMEELGLSEKFTLSGPTEPVMLIPVELEPKL